MLARHNAYMRRLASIDPNASNGQPQLRLDKNGQVIDSNSLQTFLSGSSMSTMNGAGGDALSQLLAQLLGGGTAEQQASQSNRQQEIAAVRGQRNDYSKSAAMSDAQGAVAAQQRSALKELLPSINNASLGAGTSQGSMRALLLQDAAQKAADSSAALGLKASVDYGNISANLSSTLEALTRQNDPQTMALIEALKLKNQQQQTYAQANQGYNGDIGNTGGITRGGAPSTDWSGADFRSYHANDPTYNRDKGPSLDRYGAAVMDPTKPLVPVGSTMSNNTASQLQSMIATNPASARWANLTF
jgi:hypothetical protein